MYEEPSAASGLAVFLTVVGLIWAIIVVWGVILWIRVGSRWLRLHPEPPRSALPYNTVLPRANVLPATPSHGESPDLPDASSTGSPDPGEQAIDIQGLAARARTGETPAQLAERLGVSITTASSVSSAVAWVVRGHGTYAQQSTVRQWQGAILGRESS